MGPSEITQRDWIWIEKMDEPQKGTGKHGFKNKEITKWILSLRYLGSAWKRLKLIMIQGDTWCNK